MLPELSDLTNIAEITHHRIEGVALAIFGQLFWRFFWPHFFDEFGAFGTKNGLLRRFGGHSTKTHPPKCLGGDLLDQTMFSHVSSSGIFQTTTNERK